MGSPSSRPAGHRQSVREQAPRAEPARARLLARPPPGGWARGCRRRGSRQDARGHGHGRRLGPEPGKDSGSARWNGGRILARRARPPLPLAAAPDASWGQRPGRKTRTLSPGPRSRWSSDFCSCGHFGRPVLFLAVWNPKIPTALRPRAPTLRRRGAARRALCNMRLGVGLATLAGLLLTAAGEAFSGKRGHFGQRLGRAGRSGSPGRRQLPGGRVLGGRSVRGGGAADRAPILPVCRHRVGEGPLGEGGHLELALAERTGREH